ncbi:MAG TPA: hypothetical protein PKM57_12590 [Kiritimatiellia bacterium]|nr:hypothetical protein [Kiritimatiellia bacterium]HPS07169.1 hypothetical protein [Kiritimatiellia bacterium]
MKPADAKATIGKYNDLHKLRDEFQIELMEKWFREHYEDPIENCPGDEGCPVYIHGGPYDAREELEREFSGYVADTVIDILASRLTDENLEWAGIPKHDDYENDDYDVTIDPYKNLEIALSVCETMAYEQFSDVTSLKIYGLLYCHLITALEVYYESTFKKQLLATENPNERFQNALSSLKNVKGAKSAERIDLKKKLSSRVWHRIDDNQVLFKQALDIDLPDAPTLKKAVGTRHDITHRDFKTKDGKQLAIDRPKVLELSTEIRAYVRKIEFPDEQVLLAGQSYVTRVGPGSVSTEIVKNASGGYSFSGKGAGCLVRSLALLLMEMGFGAQV